MAINIEATATSVEVGTSAYNEISVNIVHLNLAEYVSAEAIVAEYSASSLLDAIGYFDDWVEEGRVRESDVAEWLVERGYKVEKE